MKRKILDILTVALITLSSCLGSIYPQYTSVVKAETTETAPEAENASSNQLMIIEGEIEIKADQQIQEDKQNVDLTVTASTDNLQIHIQSIRAPDGTVTEGNEINYAAPCNGTYEFEVFYEKGGEEKSQLYYEYVFSSGRMTDGNKPSKANGFTFTAPEINLMADEGAATGTVYKKLYPFNVIVDGQAMGTGNWHYVAYMQDSEGRTLLCMDPNKDAADNLSGYGDVKEISTGEETIQGNGTTRITQNELSLIWYYSQVEYPKANISGLSSSDDWTFICQLMLWQKLGYPVSGYDARFQKGIDWVNAKIKDHVSYTATSYDDLIKIWKNDPWPESVETIDGTCTTANGSTTCHGGYVNTNGKVNTSGGQYVEFDYKTEFVNFGEPAYLWGDDYSFTIEDVPVDENDPTKGTYKKITGSTGGKVSIQHGDTNLAKDFKTVFDESTKNVKVTYGGTADQPTYNFERVNSITENDEYLISYHESWALGSSYLFNAGGENFQNLMQFKLPFDTAKAIKFRFSENPDTEPGKITPEDTPKDLVAPIFLKQDSEGNADGEKFPIEGATFTFHAGETYTIHFQQRKAVVVGSHQECSGEGADEVCHTVTDYDWGEWTNGPTNKVWSNGEEIFDEKTPADGKIDTSPIIQAYYDKASEIINDQLAKGKGDGSSSGDIEYQQHENYLDKEGTGWEGGQFYAMEPSTSQKTCNTSPSGSGTCKADYDGYLNLFDWEKIRFTISADAGGEQPIITHDNDRQKGRFTIHKVDAESSYLNHNNNHEAQGDGYFYGSVFVVTAREDVVLHDGTIAESVFTGKPLTKGEVADVLVLQLPLKDDGTYDTDYLNNLSSTTTQMFDLGQYATQEIRWPGVYKEDLPLVYDDEDGLWHVDPAKAGDVLAKLKDKTSVYYQFDYDKAEELFQEGILPVSSPDGGYWYKGYVNGITNTTNAAFTGGQMINIDIKYVGQDKAYNEVIPNHTKAVGNVTVNGEEVTQSIPDENYSITRGEDYQFTVNVGLDYENSIQKGHIQFKKILTQKTGIENGDNTGIVDTNNVPAADVYFAIYLDRKANQTIQDTTEAPIHLPDQFYASKRMDGLEYVFDNKGNFELYAEDKVNGAVTGYHLATSDEIAQRKGLVMVYTDQTQTTMKPADNYYEWKLVNLSDNVSAVMKLNTFVNPSKAQDVTALTNQNLSNKDLYMVLKTNAEGKAGTNMPETVAWANNAVINGLINTSNNGSVGDWDYQTALKYDKSHTEALAYLQESGLPLPYGVSYTIVELNAPEGYEGVSWQAEVTKNLTTYDINEVATVWELGIEKGVAGGYLSGNENPSGWTARQTDVKGDGTAKDETWLNKQFHIFNDYVSTTTIGNNIEDKLHKQMLQIVKIDAETGERITVDNASFMIWQWNSNLALNDNYKRAAFDHQTKTWKVTYDVPEYDIDGTIKSIASYDGTGYYTDSKGLREILGQWIKVPAGSSGIYTTDTQGLIPLEQPIPVGNYFLLEMKAPEGYLQNKEPIPFEITWNGSTTKPNEEDFINVPLRNEDGSFVCQPGKVCNDPDSDDYAYDQYGNAVLENVQTEKAPNFITIIISAEDKHQKGYVEVEKRGSIFDKFVQYTTDLLQMIGFKPTWKDDQIINLNTSFCLYAEEDVIVNNDLKYKADECIQKMMTDTNGHAYSEPVYLGKYYVTECDAPHGYITNQEKMYFELTYDGEVQIVHPTFTALKNERQKLQIELYKTDEQRRPLANAIFGIYAAEDLPTAYEEEKESLKPTMELLPQQMQIETHADGTATLIAIDSLDNYRVIVPEKVTVDGKEYTITAIGDNAFNFAGIKGLLLPSTIKFVGDGAFLNNPDLDYLEFTSKNAPLFASKNIFPIGKWEQKCTENVNGITCDLVFNPDENSLLGIYIPWGSLASYDLAKIGSNIFDSITDNEGVKDNRLLGVLLKDGNNGHEVIDEDFNGIRFDVGGFSNQGIVKNTVLNLTAAEALFDFTEGTKTIDGDEITGIFITNYKGSADTVTVPEAIIQDGKQIRVAGIDERALAQKKLKEILIPESIHYIGKEALAENEELTTIRFYETEYQHYSDASNNGSTNIDDDVLINKNEERCGTTGGSWKDQGDGTYACAYSIPTQKETTEDECGSLSGTYAEGMCSYEREVFGEMPEENLDEEGTLRDDAAGIALMELGAFSRSMLVGNDTEPLVTKTNSQIACEANGGTWNTETGTCKGGEVFEDLDDDMGYDNRSNSQIACEALGNTWDALTGTCSSEHKPMQPTDPDLDPAFTVSQSRVALYLDESALNYTPMLSWIIVSEENYERFDQAFIISNDTVKSQDEKLDGYLYWNPNTLNPINGTAGYWDFGSDLPALQEHPLTLNRLINEDPIDGGMQIDPIVPDEMTGISAGTLIEIVKTDAKGHAVTQFDYPEGKYMIKELQAPEGYSLSYETYLVDLKYKDNEEPVVTVVVNNGNPIINKKFVEHPLRIEVFKVDGNTLKGLGGAEFELWNHDRSTVLENLVTDGTGHAVTKGLYNSNEYSGYLWIKETKAPNGYEINGDGWHKVDINPNASGITTLITVKNYNPDEPDKPDHPAPSGKEVTIRLQLIKSLEKDKLYGNEQAWKDVQFGIYAAEDLYSDRKEKHQEYHKDELIFTSGIDENGILNVLWTNNEHKICDGDYYLKEIKTSDDYILNDHKYYFSFDENKDGRYKVVEINDLKPIINNLKRTTIQVMKVDEQDLTDRLAGAEFVLIMDENDLNSDGIIDEKDAIVTAISNSDGYAYFTDLPDGIWWIKEVKAPEGYEISTTWKKVTIKGTEIGIEAYDGDGNKLPSNDQGDTVTITWTNTLLPGTSETIPPSTGVDLNGPIYWLLIIISVLGILVLKSKKD